MTTEDMSEGQRLALNQLHELVAVSRGAIAMLTESVSADSDGWLRVWISLDCAEASRALGGLRLRNRERFIVLIPAGFPFDVPVVLVPHRRWAGTPHVQWGTQLCLYAAPSVEWIPADGMFGLIDRLTIWLEHAALGELDPDDQPLHPPVAYFSAENGVMVVRANLGDLVRLPAAPVVASLLSRQQAARSLGMSRRTGSSSESLKSTLMIVPILLSGSAGANGYGDLSTENSLRCVRTVPW